MPRQRAVADGAGHGKTLAARGRRYFSNDRILSRLQSEARPAADILLGETPSTRVYVLDAAGLRVVSEEPGG